MTGFVALSEPVQGKIPVINPCGSVKIP